MSRKSGHYDYSLLLPRNIFPHIDLSCRGAHACCVLMNTRKCTLGVLSLSYRNKNNRCLPIKLAITIIMGPNDQDKYWVIQSKLEFLKSVPYQQKLLFKRVKINVYFSWNRCYKYLYDFQFHNFPFEFKSVKLFRVLILICSVKLSDLSNIYYFNHWVNEA